jgi:acylglycerol lipase
MPHLLSSFRTDDGLRLHTESWLPDGTPHAALVIVHGYGEHLGRYAHACEYFVEQGYAVYALDHRGHGQSEGLRAYVEQFDDFLRDLHRYVEEVRAENGGRKLFMLGHSMGALISLAYCQRYDDADRLIISGAPVNADANVSPLLVQVGNVLTQVVPRLPFLEFGEGILSRDPRVQARFDADPLTWKRPMRVRLGVEINRAAGRVRAELPRLHLPILILHGGDDSMVNPSGSTLAYETVGSQDKTLKLYPGLLHEIMNEPEQGDVLADIAAWIRERR